LKFVLPICITQFVNIKIDCYSVRDSCTQKIKRENQLSNQ